MNQIDEWIFGENVTSPSWSMYWENIYHRLDDEEPNTVHHLARLLLTPAGPQIDQVHSLFVDDRFDSLLITSRGSEYRFKLQHPFVTTENNDELLIGTKFDVKEYIFRSLLRVVGAHEKPQLLIKVPKRQQDKLASVAWISPFGQVVALNESFNINSTLGHHVLNFPPHLPLVAGVWSALYIDEMKTVSEINFLIADPHTSQNHVLR